MHILKRIGRGLLAVLDFIVSWVFRLVRGIWSWLKGMGKALYGLWCALGPKWMRVTLAVAAVGVATYFTIKHLAAPNLTEENIYQVRHLNKGWTDQERDTFYYTPQGTELLGLQYNWFINLELPVSREQLASEENMRGWGFIMDPNQRPSKRNPGNLPVGFTYHYDSKQRLNLDLGCAMCHTGELHYKGTALRVDGGQSMQSISDLGIGEFITTLGAASFETYLNPAKWNRFVARIVGEDEQKREVLREDFKRYLSNLYDFGTGPGAMHWYPVKEGRGRTDAVGRIGNVVFGYNLKEPGNYQIADAPASYPYLWDMWRLDWVQYTGFTNQAMARNVGESLGVLAPVKLVDDEGNLLPVADMVDDMINLDGMHCVEGVLRKLEPPRWPEDVLGKVNLDRAKRGKDLFAEQCQSCHGPHESDTYMWEVATEAGQSVDHQINLNPDWDKAGDLTEVGGKWFRQDLRQTVWSVPWISTDVIGTDSKLADNYMHAGFDASKLGYKDKVNAGNGLQLLLNVLIPNMYEKRNIKGAAIPEFDGLNVPFRIANHRAYKAKPLHGVWATPPFLHNGSVPTIYHMLSPMRQRPTTFHVGNREYNPQLLGYVTTPGKGSFKMDTSIAGNRNTGHLFTDMQVQGRIGRLLTEGEKLDLMEYLKVMGNPDYSERLGGDPQRWDKYEPGIVEPHMQQACDDAVPRAYERFKSELASVNTFMPQY